MQGERDRYDSEVKQLSNKPKISNKKQRNIHICSTAERYGTNEKILAVQKERNEALLITCEIRKYPAH